MDEGQSYVRMLRSGKGRRMSGMGRPKILSQLTQDSLGTMRPSLVWLFNHIRQDDEQNLTKGDLRKLLGSQLNSRELDEAFDNLDTDGDGEISLEEFIAGVARFWKEAPNTPSIPLTPSLTPNLRKQSAAGDQPLFTFSPSQLTKQSVQACPEECYEYGGEDGWSERKKPCPSEQFQGMLSALSLHNRYATRDS